MVQRAGEDRHPAAAAPETPVRDDGAQPLGIGVEQFAVQSAEDDPVGVEDVHQTGEAESQTVDQLPHGDPDARVLGAGAQQVTGLLEKRDLGSWGAAGRGEEGERVGLDVQAATAAAVAADTVGPMTKWEYVTVPLLVHATKQILDTWGEDGWELVQVVPGPNNPEQLVAYLKRAKS